MADGIARHGPAKRESRTRILHASASIASGWGNLVALDWVRYLVPVAVRKAMEQQLHEIQRVVVLI
jgi:hypothetical protein